MKSRSYSTAVAIIMVQVVSVVICNAATIATGNDCYTRKTKDNKCCVFPFEYNGKMYHDCTTEHDNKPWCSLTGNFAKDQKYGYCDDSAPIFDNILKINDNDKVARVRESGVELFQGDIVLTPALKKDLIEQGILPGNLDPLKKRKPRAVMRNRIARWIGANGRPEVPYVIERSNAHASGVIRQAMAHWTAKVPCIQFVRRSSQRTYLSFFSGGGCYSRVGRQSRGAQRISIGRGCDHMGVVAHEIGHALGFWHEQSRTDRDSYVRINWGNIRRGTEHNFRKYGSNQINSLGVPYDYMSLMHYSSTAFANRRGAYTIVRRDGGTNLGQRYGLSPKDVQQANMFYCGSAPRPTQRPRPTQPPRPTRSPTGCRYTDSHSRCPYWASRGFCSKSSRYYNYMTRTCKKSCFCRSTSSCNDNIRVTRGQCSSWRRRGYCNRFKTYMRANCKKTCGQC